MPKSFVDPVIRPGLTSDAGQGRPAQTDGGAPSLKSGPELVRFMAALLRADDIETVWALTCEHFMALGFGHLLYGYSPTFFRGDIGAREQVLLLSTLERPVVDMLVDKGYFSESITFNWALENVGIAGWSMTAEEAALRPGFAVSEGAKAFFRDNGFGTGCCIGFPTARTRCKAVMALFGAPGSDQGDVDDLISSQGDSLLVAASMAHMRLYEMPYIKGASQLTHRQREVLEWVAEGKTIADIAAILGISAVTVEKHLRLARETLDVATTAHAAIKANFLNQLFLYAPGNR